MTAEQKNKLALFLDLAGDCLRDGYRLARKVYDFSGSFGEAPEGKKQGEAPSEISQSPSRLSAVHSKTDSLDAIAAEVYACSACPLAGTRTRAVPGEGVNRPLVLVVGEGPGAEEDLKGRPFVGAAGQLLDTMLAAIGLSRERNCFIANAVKCRPPDNRTPLPEETAACAPFLARQITLLKPLIILGMGRTAAKTLLGAPADVGIGKLRGRFAEYNGMPGILISPASQIPVLPTYHPSALLRNQDLKRPAWEDLKILRTKLNELDENYAVRKAWEN